MAGPLFTLTHPRGRGLGIVPLLESVFHNPREGREANTLVLQIKGLGWSRVG